MRKSFALIVFALIITSCGNKKQPTQQTVIVQPEKPKIESAAQQAGKKVYSTVCLACHQADGSGVPGMHPPIIESKSVNGDPDRLIRIVLEGMSGKIEVDGEIYNSIMPPHAYLSNKEIADVLTYVRSSFGNNSGEITMDQVQKNRDRKK